MVLQLATPGSTTRYEYERFFVVAGVEYDIDQSTEVESQEEADEEQEDEEL
jgi:hypothetical protein